ncbi:Two-component hybrid sensor and response regulator histidine kinase [Desulfamplus magnetovallimortis]|uniref:histidine kinase n=1 Tax=Desulfamplus magnetovallimortis TaxID=1246637 RepID=A0A1W1HDB3_9BACT|nr:PAS domain-containing protein [Desulfamplus magnetovallimortis]SLM30469.1 Two-component hybrid sensor and response regulator histidine kinase [Desulfamplus magnetovallimortis]
MRLRMIILVLALLAVLSASSGGFLYYYSLKHAAFQQAQSHSDTRLELLSRQLNSYLSEHVKPVKVLSCMEEMNALLLSAEKLDVNPADRSYIEKSSHLPSGDVSIGNSGTDSAVDLSLEKPIDLPAGDVNIGKINYILDNFAHSLTLEVCYIMNRDGVTIASSNRNDHDSFVGKDFSFRPYFMNAISGIPSTYLALGTTTRQRGVYYSHPVYCYAEDNNFSGESARNNISARNKISALNKISVDSGKVHSPGNFVRNIYSSELVRDYVSSESAKVGQVCGVAVIKASVERIESRLFVGSEGILLVTDPNGVIFIANRREMRFMLLWKLDREQIEKINETRQFGDGPWLWTGFSFTGDNSVTDRNGKEYIYSDMALEGYEGWCMVHLRSLDEISRHLADPFIRIVGPVILVIAGFIAVSVFILYRKALQEILRRKKAENELRLSEARYRHIYHKTPVMLHSIDRDGCIIRVSDYWLEKMGYSRDEVIGRKLTDFYSVASKKYAEEVVFPVFFQTGFCEDVPYTYIAKNGRHIEIMLSCYGVRDDSGRVIRSLAVSVDVTEKNQAQHDLEKAREKLSCYSMDLEQQVEKRTDELRKVQDQLRKLSGSIMAAHENERRAVARELHDHLGQILTALKMDASWISRHLESRDQDAAERASRICGLIDDTIADVREMAFRLRPGVLDDLGLVDALEFLAREFEKRSDVSCRFRQVGEMVPDLDDTLATALYRIAQEALTNALKHSCATDILVTISFKEVFDHSQNFSEISEGKGIVDLYVEDNGSGFILHESREYHGLGLTGMKERANLVGGKLDIISTPGQGTRIVCRVMLKNETKKRREH